MSSFVTSRSKRLFELLTDGEKDPQNFLADDVLKKHVRTLKVVNDSAERAIVLIKQFAGAVKDENQSQYLLSVIKHHRGEVPKRTKAVYTSFSSVNDVRCASVCRSTRLGIKTLRI